MGTFQLADYGFTVEPQADGTVPSEYEWDFNNGPRGASWKQKFVQAIIAKGIVASRLTSKAGGVAETAGGSDQNARRTDLVILAK